MAAHKYHPQTTHRFFSKQIKFQAHLAQRNTHKTKFYRNWLSQMAAISTTIGWPPTKIPILTSFQTRYEDDVVDFRWWFFSFRSLFYSVANRISAMTIKTSCFVRAFKRKGVLSVCVNMRILVVQEQTVFLGCGCFYELQTKHTCFHALKRTHSHRHSEVILGTFEHDCLS